MLLLNNVQPTAAGAYHVARVLRMREGAPLSVFDGGGLDVPVYLRDGLLDGHAIDGPAVIEEAAGVLKFRRRKEKAERRLQATEAGNKIDSVKPRTRLLPMLERLVEMGYGVSPASLRLDDLTEPNGWIDIARERLRELDRDLA